MSGGLSPQLQQAASGAALRAEAAALGMHPAQLLKSRFLDGRERPRESAAAATWRKMDPTVRTFLILATIGGDGEAARRPWDSFSDEERSFLGSTARLFSRQLADASLLR
jgi:hypothetical protein